MSAMGVMFHYGGAGAEPEIKRGPRELVRLVRDALDLGLGGGAAVVEHHAHGLIVRIGLQVAAPRDSER